jgi:putative DNA primase/helicase
LKFISEITAGGENFASFLQRVVGYVLTGLTSEQCLFLLLGTGSNGKSVFLRVIEMLLGQYALGAPPETLLVKRDTSGASPDVARLRGARLVVASEPKDGSILEEALVKRLTGQDKIVSRGLYRDFFEYLPTFKFFLATNYKPIIRGTDYAIWRRIHLIPFDVTFLPNEQDKQLIEKLTAELPGILNWAVKGTLIFLQNGLNPPNCVVAATQSYRSEMDVLEQWIEDECVRDPTLQTLVATLFAAYSRWCKNNNLGQLTKRAFGDQLEAKGFERARAPGGARLRRGIGLRGGVT